ncbi:NeuD/PglB/VioB family sugar acetyltransferase [Pontibacter akesuensis]|uniref:Sugar O-acyltransferase, sialic acid O-acetyltransferase NeuD family n=1 Tax=Pontibacter akesuensis TaxID=388950 RepID=A0A1I7J336_9BACT|nr:NeuD/PglB/VioB family sugar acetyltransferase [Pontibacter akesuensis]GHA72698.1 acetyltransferase [Pontibacter akesuensis]SFU79593.1 sugar O-acyltransferase, sialic acid O-acetyltransferase NeuD family [Pontibacter akesuensis]
MQNPVIILGADKLGTTALDIFNSNNVIVYCFLDDNQKLQQEEVNNVAVMSNTEDGEFLKLIGKKCDVFVAVEDTAARKGLIKMLKTEHEVVPVNAIHKFSAVSENAWMGHGIMVGAGAIINNNAKIGDNCIINSRALVDTKAEVGNFVEIGAGAIINADVVIEEGAFIGSGAVVVSGVKIGKNARVGAGSVVVADVAAKATVFGNPAAPIK